MKATYQPIKRGMTEAVTRGELEAAAREGREPIADVKQLTWFDTKGGIPCIFGVIAGVVYSWYADGTYNSQDMYRVDIFALPRYEWQWNIIEDGKYIGVTDWYTSVTNVKFIKLIDTADYVMCKPNWTFERIEGSKRLVKE